MNAVFRFLHSLGSATALFAILSPIGCLGWQIGPPGKPYEGWPKIVVDPSGPVATYEHFRVSIAAAADQTDSGTGGEVSDIKIKNMRSGKVLTIEVQCVGWRVLEKYKGYPQIETWGRGGGGSYSRQLFRVESGEYKAIRDDGFDRNINDASRKDVIASVPGGEGPLYYTGTMYP